jgi:hypothetical protein
VRNVRCGVEGRNVDDVDELSASAAFTIEMYLKLDE